MFLFNLSPFSCSNLVGPTSTDWTQQAMRLSSNVFKKYYSFPYIL